MMGTVHTHTHINKTLLPPKDWFAISLGKKNHASVHGYLESIIMIAKVRVGLSVFFVFASP